MYITLEELNTIMPSIFLTSELSTIDWANCTPEDKQVLITRSSAFLDSLDYDINKIDDAFSDSMQKSQVCVVYDLLANINNSRYELRKQGVKSINTGGVSESYTDEKVEEISDRFKQYIGRYLSKRVISRFL